MKKNFFLCFLLLFMSLKVAFASVGSSELNSMKGLQVLSISYEGDSLPENIDTRISRTIGTSFSPFLVKNILLWHHENEGDSFLRISARKISRGVELKVFYKKKQKIEKISFIGNRDISANALETLIDFKEGFDYEPKLTEIAVQKLIAYYGKQGYFATDIKATFDERKKELLFTIFEGDPTYLDSLEISPIETIELPALKARYERDIREIFGLRVGDKIQRDKVLDGLKNIKDWLRDHDFLISKDPALEYKVDASGKVGLVIRIDYGNRIRFGFRGNNLFSYRELMNFVSELKEVTSGAEYLNSVKRRIEEEYEKIGYVNINVSTLVRDDANRGIRYVSVIIEENEKVRMKSLRIDGIYSFSKEEIEKVFNNSASRIVQRGFYQEEGVQLASELVVEYLQSKGFLSARLEFIKADFNEERTEVNVSILFNEGIQSRIKSITIDGNKNLSEQEILSFLKVKLDEPFNIFEFENGLIQIKEKYGEIGYLNAQIANEGSDSIVKYSRDNSNVDLLVEVDEGPQFTVGEIIVSGNKKTHARVVVREMPFIDGDVLTRPLIIEAEENLRKLNLFSSVTISPIDRPGSNSVKDILVLIKEASPGSFQITPGFRNDLGLRLGFEVAYQNLGGWNRTVNARAVFNRRMDNNGYRFPEYNFSIGFKEPYLANWPVVFTSNLNVIKRQYSGFDAKVNRVSVGLRREFSKYLSGFLEYSYERVEIFNPQGDSYASYVGTDIIGSMTPGIIIDSRNDKYNPSTGFYSINRFEWASKYFGSRRNVDFYRTTSNNSAYFPIPGGIVFAAAVNMGWERSNIRDIEIPPFKLFRLGGIGSIRGYGEDSIEVETNKTIFGVLGSLNYRAEFRIPISGSLGSAIFLDAGNLMVDRFSFEPRKLRSSTGAGLRYITPVGPVALDFAWKLQGDGVVGDTRESAGVSGGASVDRFKIHFSIGSF